MKRLLPRFKRFFKQILVIFLILIILSGVAMKFWTKEASAAWFDPNWSYRTAIPITTHTGNEVGVYVDFVIDTATPIAAGKMQSDCGDLRFTTYSGDLLPYYIPASPGCNNASTHVHVNFDSFPSGVQTIYYYYGNPSATNGFSATDFSTATPTQGDQTFQVSASGNDGDSNTNGISGDITRSTLRVGNDSNAKIAGLRFLAVGIQQNSTITLATLTLTAQATYNCGACTLRANIYGEASDNAAIYTAAGSNISGRTKTSASVATGSLASVVASTQYPFSIITPTQEVISRGGWVSGNALSLLIQDNASTTSEWQDFHSYDGSTSLAPTLRITWNTPDLVIGSVGSEEQGPGPAGYWKFDEGTGTSAKDSTGGTNTGTLAGTTLPTWQSEDSCLSGKCLYFNGITSRVTVANTISAKTVSFWVKSATSSASLIQLTSTSDIRASAGSITTSNITSPTVYINGIAGSSGYTANKWNYVTVTSATAVTANAISIGKSLLGNLNGYIDEVRIYPYVRTAAQVKIDYNSRGGGAGSRFGNASLAAINTGLVGYWKFDEASWTVNCSTNTVLDSSGNGLNGRACPNSTGPAGGGQGKFKSGGLFDGTNDAVEITDPSSGILDMGTGNFTVSAWVKRTGNAAFNGPMPIISKSNQGGSDAGFTLKVAGSDVGDGDCNDAGVSLNEVCIELSDGTNSYTMSTSVTAVTADSLWHLVTAVIDRSNDNNMNLYVDGVVKPVLRTGKLSSLGSISNSNPLCLGNKNAATCSTTQNAFNGSLDEIRFYNRALSAGEVQTLYNWAPSPVGYWNMEEGTGTTIKDISGNSNTSSAFTGDVAFTGGKVGKALSFDGVNDVVRIPETTSTDIGAVNDSYTISAWVKTTQNVGGNEAYFVSKFGPTGNFPFTFGLDSSELLKFEISGTPSGDDIIGGSTSVSDGKWHYVTAVKDKTAGKLFLYLDGVSDATAVTITNTTNTAANDDDIAIGNGGPSYTTADFAGQIDDVKIYNYARSQKQVIEDMNGSHPAPGSPVGSAYGYWKFDEGADNTCTGGTNDACNSGNGGVSLDGAKSNMATGINTSGWTGNGKYGKALSFDGTNDFLDVGDLTGTETATQVTWSMWLKPSVLATRKCIFCKVNTPAGTPAQASWALMTDTTDSTRVRAIISNAANDVSQYGLSPAGTLSNNSWTYIAAVYDGSLTATDRVKIYANGELVTTTITGTIPTSIRASTASSVFGRASSDATALYNGTIDEPKVFLAALSPDQIKMDMNRGSAQVLGSLSTIGATNVASNSASAEYCVPGDSTSCTDPVGMWKFEEHLGTTANDITGNGLTGTLTNGPRWSSGKAGAGILFDGSDDRVTVSDNTLLKPNSISISLWTKYSGAGDSFSRLLDKSDNGSTGYRLERMSDDSTCTGVSATNNITFQVNTTNLGLRCVTSTSTLQTNVWTHIEATYDGTALKLYINGILESTTTAAGGNMSSGAQNLDIGGDFQSATESFNYNGIIDELRIYNYARSLSQVALDYNRGGPVGWWKMDECSGSNIQDNSGNRLTGTITVGGTGTQTSVGSCATSSTAWGNGATGKLNSSVNLDGTDDYMQVNSPIFPTTDFTYAGWVNLNSTNDTIFTVSDGTGDSEFRLDVGEYCPASKLCVSLNATYGVLTSTNSIPLSTWTHIAVVRSGSTISTYINGKQDVTTATDGSLLSSTCALFIGVNVTSGCSSGLNQYMSGKIDDVRVYNYALTGAQIRNVYNGGGSVRFAPVTGTP